MKRFLIKLLSFRYQQEILLVLFLFCLIICVTSTMEIWKIKYCEVFDCIGTILFWLIIINGKFNPYLRKTLRKVMVNYDDVSDSYMEAKKVMLGRGKNHYSKLTCAQKKESLLGKRG